MPTNTIPVQPLLQWIHHERKVKEAVWCKKFGIEQAVLTNWKRRGISHNMLPKIAAEMGIDTDEYLSRAGRLPAKAIKQRTLDGPALALDFDTLPPGLQAYVTKTAAQLRKVVESFPMELRGAIFTPPKEKDRYAEWERGIEGLISKFGKEDT